MRRWAEIRDAMVSAGHLSQADAAALTYPPVRPRTVGPRGDDLPAGIVVNHVLSELTHGDTPMRGMSWTVGQRRRPGHHDHARPAGPEPVGSQRSMRRSSVPG